MNFSMSMTIDELVVEMNSGGNQGELYKLSKIKKDVLPYIFRAAGYTREKQKYVPTDAVQPSMTIEQLVPLAKALRLEVQQQQLGKIKKESAAAPVVIDPPTQVPANTGANTNELTFNFADKAEMQTAILEVLDLTAADLEALRALKGEAPTGTIYEAINKLGSRIRSNKTYYLSTEIVQQVQEFTERHTIKTSQFVEIALLEAMRKYES